MKRSLEKEWMDLGLYSQDEYEDCLYQLSLIGRILGGNRATFWAFDQLKEPPETILDVGCGGGFFTQLLAKRYPHAKVVGYDISEEAIAFARKKNPNVTFTTELPPQHFDVVTATLLCHHLSDEELVQFLKMAFHKSNKAVILNDLHRHWLAYCGFWFMSVFLNRMVRHDGLLSIRRSLTRQEWIDLLKRAEIGAEISRHWAFRYIVRIHK